jgi:uncharacterized damage-inducible protein DinB
MTSSLLGDAFDHHVWATLRVLDTLDPLSADQLGTAVTGTYGSILDTARHLVGGDAWYLLLLTGDQAFDLDEDQMGLPELRRVMESNATAWPEFLARDLDPDAVVMDVDEAGWERDASIGIRLAQALHHGNDHRSQICTTLTAIGVEPPGIGVWEFGEATGRVIERPPAGD